MSFEVLPDRCGSYTISCSSTRWPFTSLGDSLLRFFCVFVFPPGVFHIYTTLVIFQERRQCCLLFWTRIDERSMGKGDYPVLIWCPLERSGGGMINAVCVLAPEGL